jgi:hypothetical protein
VPTLHREPQKWEATIPVCKVNRKVNDINDLATSPPCQCSLCAPSLIALKTKGPLKGRQ